MYIGFIIGVLDYSGAEKIARYLLQELHEKGHDVGIVLISKEDKYPEFEYAKQFPLLANNKVKIGKIKYFRVFYRQRAIKRIVEEEKFDAVISFGVKFNIDVMEALKGTRAKVILCERNDPVNDPHRIILRIRRRLCYPYATAFVFQTERIAEFFGEKIRSRSVIIPNFIENRCKYLFDENNENVIILTARLDEQQKNISMLLRVFKVFSEDSDYSLVIVGDGPDKDRYEQYIKENNLAGRVRLPGKQNVYPYLKKAKIFVLPSYYEGMPNSLIEAMAVGLPCIATDCSGGGAAYLIQDHVNGLLIPSNDDNALLSALKELASDSALRSKLSKEAYKINDRLDLEKIVSQWITFIEMVGKA